MQQHQTTHQSVIVSTRFELLDDFSCLPVALFLKDLQHAKQSAGTWSK